MKHILKSKNFPLIITAVIAVVIRCICFVQWLFSPFGEYVKINGLDMKTHMMFAEMFREGAIGFSLHRFLCVATTLFSGGKFSIPLIIAAQMFLGIFLSVFCAYIALRLSGSRLCAVVSGVAAALYAPMIMYESCTQYSM